MNELTTFYHFVPAVRRGLATAIAEEAAGDRATLAVRLHVAASGSEAISDEVETSVQLYGPGDILGFDSRIVTRTDPLPNVGDFEPNYFPMIEFADPDFPWRYTAAAGVAAGLIPWIALIVLELGEFDEGEHQQHTGTSKDPEVPWIEVLPAVPLPDPAEAWRWAHVQVTGEQGLTLDAARFEEFDATAPERVVSRLLCARRLKPGTAYEAFVVPTFKLGCVAANRATLGSGEGALTPAWDTSAGGVQLPYYYRWRFHTGQRGDFEYLVRLLEPRKLTDLGFRPMDCAGPGYGSPAIETPDNVLGLEGALKSVGLEYTPWAADDLMADPPGGATPFQAWLAAELLNKPYNDLSARDDDREFPLPTVVPPIYGRWHRGRFGVRTDGAAWVQDANDEWVRSEQYPWIDELNLDPRHRVAAGFGSLVVERQQEALMASAWDQLGQIEDANEVFRRAQLGREASDMIFRRLGALGSGDFVRATRAVHRRVLLGDSTIERSLARSSIPGAALDPALRRIRRSRGPLGRRQHSPDPDARDMLQRLNDGSLRASGPARRPDGMVDVCDVTESASPPSPPGEPPGGVPPPVEPPDDGPLVGSPVGGTGTTTGGSGTVVPGNGTITPETPGERFCEEFITCAAIQSALEDTRMLDGVHLPEGVTLEMVLEALCGENGVLEGWLKVTPTPTLPIPPVLPVDLDQIVDALKRAMDPRAAIAKRVKRRLHLSEDVAQGDDDLAPAVASPEFPQPMYEPLRDISQDLVLPGVERVPQNTLALVETNGRFAESYMAALSHTFTGELFWRGAPVSGRATYFRQFWDVSDYIPGPNELGQLLARYLIDREVASVSELPPDEKEAVLRRHRPTIGDTSEMDEVAIDELVENLLKEELLTEKLKDIKRIHEWGDRTLGSNDNRASEDGERLVLLVRGDLLRKYPNTLVYAVPAVGSAQEDRSPGLPEFGQTRDRIFPMFSGTLPPDLYFFGFPFYEHDARGIPDEAGRPPKYDLGVYFVLEERVSEARFGMDVAPEGELPDLVAGSRDALTWGHMATSEGAYVDAAEPAGSDDLARDWNMSSAAIAQITVQKPVRIAVHTEELLPEPQPAE